MQKNNKIAIALKAISGFLKLTKNKARLFLSMIISSFIAGVLFILINRFLIVNYYLGWHQSINFFISIFQYIIIAYLTIVFYKKKISPQGEYCTIFKVAILLIIFSFLYQLFLSYIGRQMPNMFFSNWVNAGFVAINLVWYYLLSCVIYDFDKIMS